MANTGLTSKDTKMSTPLKWFCRSAENKAEAEPWTHHGHINTTHRHGLTRHLLTVYSVQQESSTPNVCILFIY